MHRTRADLDLLARVVLDQLRSLDAGNELGRERQHTVDSQDVGDEVVREHGEAIEIVKRRGAGSLQVSGGDLGAFEEGNRQLVIPGSVREALPAAQASCQHDG